MSDEKTTDEEDTISVPLPGTEAGSEPEPEAEKDAESEMLKELDFDLADVRNAMESLGRTLAVVMAEFERLSKLVIGEEGTVIHACPPDGSGLMPCCGRSPIDVPLTERISIDGTAVTCTGPQRALPSS